MCKKYKNYTHNKMERDKSLIISYCTECGRFCNEYKCHTDYGCLCLDCYNHIENADLYMYDNSKNTENCKKYFKVR